MRILIIKKIFHGEIMQNFFNLIKFNCTNETWNRYINKLSQCQCDSSSNSIQEEKE